MTETTFILPVNRSEEIPTNRLGDYDQIDNPTY
jgi:hypothetical protein